MEKLDLHQRMELLQKQKDNAYVDGFSDGVEIRPMKKITYFTVGILLGMFINYLLIN